MKTPEPGCGRSRPLRRTALSAALAAAAIAGGVHAAEIDYQLELALLHSDNINLSEDNQAKDTILIPRLAFEARQQGTAIALHARGELERRHYFDNTFPDETRTAFAGQLDWALLPERMHLVFEDYLSHEPIDIRDGRYPGNLQRVNVFLAGPSFLARFGERNRLRLDLRASDSHAEVTPGFDGRRYSAVAALQHELTATSRASINVASTRAEFDDPPPVATDYTLQEGFGRYEGSLRGIEYEIDLGHARLNRAAGDDATTTIARATATWQISPRSRLRLRARHQFSDEVQDLVVRMSDPDEPLAADLAGVFSPFVTAGVYRQRSAEIDYRFNGQRLSLRLRPLYRHLRYFDRPQNDRTMRSAYYRIGYRVRPRADVFFEGYTSKHEFLTQPREDMDHVHSLGIDYRMTRHLSWRAEVMRNTRASTQADPRYRENAAQLTIVWMR
ncbi:hypothetical protein [Cognatiluteimonas weifangensis]|uniref:Outer membrane beta-barrel protein n=1 Tax=Cognatiluteimonas weifangensis TaxID=2303539 RepID=A0A372DJ29_9GAMM|nr:hypothetical protein [Luteimonas weifangensis]RFP59553.1 hypothetical protein D0Y53_10505 [Luteimonas weifangensis]